MTRSASPLRYPGGKACLHEIAVRFLKTNNLIRRVYVEPYSGGCGLALNLLYSGHVTQLHLNDLDRSVWAFWHSITELYEEFIDLIDKTSVTVDEWRRQREVQSRKHNASVLELGFSTFFLNRTNRSGIIHSGGMIGGNQQEGSWKIDCRFNKTDLKKRLNRIRMYKNRIRFYNEDAEVFLDRIGNDIPKDAVAYIDPPYFGKGAKLYRNFYRASDHKRIAERLAKLQNPWFMTYDNVVEIQNLYQEYSSAELDIGYSIQTKRRGSEIIVVSLGLRLPEEDRLSAH